MAFSSDSSSINPEQSFELIDTFLPYQACFYHQILPLELNDQVLRVGMSDPEDASALDFIGSILASSNRSVTLRIESLDADTIQALLSAYLNYSRTNKELKVKAPSKTVNDISTLIIDNQTQAEPIETPSPVRSLDLLRSIDIQAQHSSAPIDSLAALPAQRLLPELLSRVLAGGIGRLYFERHSEYGRILWSQNGVVQAVVEKISVETFQETLNELKRSARLPGDTVQKVKKLEIAQRYQQEPLLLRLGFMLSQHGEEATLQVLRGQALKFYQQQQMDRLGQEALQLTRQLERKLRQISLRTHFNPAPIEVLPQLREMVQDIHQKLDSLER